ncbi:hypothetical protein N7481_003176 [Penicillium waksmanii]|uniref:uncharacterized protein n=1 Tax=Penicillium waksmanii TaxID=69791 RepID=UPI0025479A2A|nr:uncharacterized protein N7481_003176 [Penicillium waksmanii]KAJ5987966.1 hypothetical protein N7481_003176 [Penicillium waksmanii]
MADIPEILNFRTASADDASAIQQLIQAAFRAEDTRQGWVADMAINSRFTVDIAHIAKTVTELDSDFLIASNKAGNMVATIAVSKLDPDLARIFMLAVDQRWQQAGLGRQVLAYAEEYCQRTWGVTRLGLDALSTRQELISWYLRRGYLKTGETKPFPRDAYSDLDLPEDLVFVQFEKSISPLDA